MSTNKIITKFGGILAILSILFLPFAGCEKMGFKEKELNFLDKGLNLITNEINNKMDKLTFNGIDVLKYEDFGLKVKGTIVIFIICGILIIILNNYFHTLISSIVGILLFIITYLNIQTNYKIIELKIGAFLGLIGFVISGVVSYLGVMKSKKK